MPDYDHHHYERGDDDTVVLDDLVRTGEASRLRRRGAMRVDHPQRQYTLFCGGEPSIESERVAAFIPSPFALTTPARRSPKRLVVNGCGALLTVSASPRHRPSSSGHTWSFTGNEDHLVPLDDSYFPPTTAARLKISRSSCGCIRQGIACAACGNPLGVRFVPCPASVHPSPPTTKRTTPYPSMSAGYARLPKAPSSPCYSYTFLSTAVTSSPAYTPPPPAPPLHDTYPSYQDVTEPSPPSYPPLLNRLITASPTPLSDEEREAYRARAPPPAQPRFSYGYAGYNQTSYDPDGESLVDTLDPELDPGSPDKAAGEMVFFPER